MKKYENQYQIRSKFNDSIKRKILGPGSENISFFDNYEIITENPESRYTTGILYPMGKSHDLSGEVDSVAYPDEESTNVDNSFLPSSIGMTFYCLMKNSKLKVNINSSYYETENNPKLKLNDDQFHLIENAINDSEIKKYFNFDIDGKTIQFVDDFVNEGGEEEKNKKIYEILNTSLKSLRVDNSKTELSSVIDSLIKILNNIQYNNKKMYCRIPLNDSLNIEFTGSILKTKVFKGDLSESTSMELFAKRQKIENLNGEVIYAVTLVLRNLSKGKRAKSFFQTQIEVPSQDCIDFKSSEDIDIKQISKMAYDDKMNLFLYKRKKTYVFGKGISAEWIISNNKIQYVRTTYLPKYEVLPMSFDIPTLKDDILQADSYIEGNNDSDIFKRLEAFTDEYKKWIDNISTIEVDEEFDSLKNDNIKKCIECFKRMKLSIEYLKNNSKALRAFKLANEAMILQRNNDAKKNDAEMKVNCFKKHDYTSMREKFKWRPFQLAFILDSLESVLNDKSKDRKKLNLIWVSTGGGKTEAYLFAIALTIIFRRLAHPSSYHGVNAIMRYTLRLLTAQQFERASKLIVSLEFMRRQYEKLQINDLGTEEISIGLWIGQSTEYTLKGAKKTLKKMMDSNSVLSAKKKNKFQVLNCPWCGYSLIPKKENLDLSREWGYYPIGTRKPKYNLCCVNKNCEFYGAYNPQNGLPVFVVDETVYKKRPSLLFGTVDKFAQAPLKEEVQNLFGSDDVKKYRRPDLVIQDELHLISGPLGSIVGLYEAGFDYIFKKDSNNLGPKYIASTATIKNADDQVKNIFNRKVVQFPPSGIDASDNFFVKEQSKDEAYGRKYIGVMATGKTQVTAEVRLMSAMLQASEELNVSDEEKDIYWTTTGYFNSIRELGKAAGLISDDVREYLKRLEKQTGVSARYLSSDGSKNVELTSRVESSDIPEILKRLKSKYSSDIKSNKSIDTLIASNMLSVGIDIDRLNSMFVVGQPKLNSEYIQATSRVGRKSLGNVFTLYNSTRSRDRSHYETFQSYHQNLYKFVESSSVTPYSAPALKKAVAAVIVMMLRNTVEDLSGDSSAIEVSDKELLGMKNEILEIIKKSSDADLYIKDADKIISNFINKWKYLRDITKEKEGNLFYYKNSTETAKMENNDKDSILLKSFEDHNEINNFDKVTNVMNSMRNVENSSYLSKNE